MTPMSTAPPVRAEPYLRSVRERLFRYLLFESPLPYSAVRRLSGVLIGERTREREIHDFRMRLSLRDILQTRLLLDGVWEPAVTRWWAFLSSRSDVVFDVGAHCGYYTLFTRSVRPDAEVHLFEPNPALCRDIRENLRLNGFADTARLNELAVSDVDGEVRLHVRDIEPAAASITTPEVYDSVRTVSSVSLDSYRRESGVDGVDLVKFDIEGAEFHALRGMRDGLREHAYRRLVLEVHSLYMPEGGPDQLRRTFLEHGYALYRIHETTASPLSTSDSIPDFDQWLVLAPDAVAELDAQREGDDLVVPEEYARIYRGVSWSPAGIS